MEEFAERRLLHERRQRDFGPPQGCADRRRLTERRVPCLVENAISDAEWQQLIGAAANEGESVPR